MDSPFKLLSAAIVHVHGNPILHNVCDSNTFRESLGVELSSVVPSLDPMGPSIPMTKRINFWILEIVSGNSIYIYIYVPEQRIIQVIAGIHIHRSPEVQTGCKPDVNIK